MTKKRFLPRKGTKRRKLMLLALRPQGFVTADVVPSLYRTSAELGSEIDRLMNDYDYEIRKLVPKHKAPYILYGKIMGYNKYRELRHPAKMEAMILASKK